MNTNGGSRAQESVTEQVRDLADYHGSLNVSNMRWAEHQVLAAAREIGLDTFTRAGSTWLRGRRTWRTPADRRVEEAKGA